MRSAWASRLGLVLLILVPVIALAHGISEEDKQRMLDGGYLQYVGLGASHMLTGYDHLLFLFGVVFFLTSFRDIVKFVTIFTVGHCITLIFATFSKSLGTIGWWTPLLPSALFTRALIITAGSKGTSIGPRQIS